MITQTPDGSTREVASSTRPRDVAESIGGSRSAAIAAKVSGEVIDLARG